MCTRLDGDGRITLSARNLICTGPSGRTETRLETGESVRTAYRKEFGVLLDRVPPE